MISASFLQVLLNLTKPYRKVTIAFIARELSLNEDEVEGLLVDMILDQKLSAQIDQIKGHVVLQSSDHDVGSSSSNNGNGGSEEELYASLSRWADKLATVNENYGVKMM